MNPLEEATNLDGSRRFYPRGQHPATHRLRRQLELAEEIAESMDSAYLDDLITIIKRDIARFEYGESVAKTQYLRALGQ